MYAYRKSRRYINNHINLQQTPAGASLSKLPCVYGTDVILLLRL